MEDVEAIVRDISWIDRFVIKHVIKRRVIPTMWFEMTDNEQESTLSLIKRGLARRSGFGYGLTGKGIRVRTYLLSQTKE